MSEETKEEEQIIIHLPKCCMDASDECPHIIRDIVEKERKNIAL